MNRILKFSALLFFPLLLLLGNSCRDTATEEGGINPACGNKIEGYWVDQSDDLEIIYFIEIQAPAEYEIQLSFPYEDLDLSWTDFWEDFQIATPVQMVKRSDQPLTYSTEPIPSPFGYDDFVGRLVVSFTACNESMLVIGEASDDAGASWRYMDSWRFKH